LCGGTAQANKICKYETININETIRHNLSITKTCNKYDIDQ